MSFTTDNGLITLERGEKPKVFRNLKGENLLSITQEGTEFFLGGNKHLWEYDYSTIGNKVKWRKIKNKIKKDSLNKIGYIAKILKDKEENLWLLGTSLSVIQKGFKKIIIYNKDNGFDSKSPTCIVSDAKKRVFVGSLNGLYYIDKYYPEEKEVNILSIKYIRKGSKETNNYRKVKRIRISFEPPEGLSERDISFEFFYNDDKNILMNQSINMAQGGLVVRNDFLPEDKGFMKGSFIIKAWKTNRKTKEKIKELPVKGSVNGAF